MVNYPKDASEKDKYRVKIVAKFSIGKSQIVWHNKSHARNKKISG
jgi:hypothetical protein